MDAWRPVDPAELLRGTVLLCVPHMDDGVLACGAAIARLERPDRVHVLYATDGKRSPEPLLPWRDRVDRERLGRDRVDEALEAMGSLGVPAENITFLGLPDGALRAHQVELERSLAAALERLGPDTVLAPFRYDRHPDHLALNRAATRLAAPQLVEYFVYHFWKLLRRGDVRRYLPADRLLRVDPGEAAGRKRAALERFRSQTTRYYAWQTRPNLTSALLDEVSAAPEVFLRYDPSTAGARVFGGPAPWIRLAHRLEPALKKRKDQVVALIKRVASP